MRSDPAGPARVVTCKDDCGESAVFLHVFVFLRIKGTDVYKVQFKILSNVIQRELIREE